MVRGQGPAVSNRTNLETSIGFPLVSSTPDPTRAVHVTDVRGESMANGVRVTRSRKI